jgi:hypothetical protein
MINANRIIYANWFRMISSSFFIKTIHMLTWSVWRNESRNSYLLLQFTHFSFGGFKYYSMPSVNSSKIVWNLRTRKILLYIFLISLPNQTMFIIYAKFTSDRLTKSFTNNLINFIKVILKVLNFSSLAPPCVLILPLFLGSQLVKALCLYIIWLPKIPLTKLIILSFISANYGITVSIINLYY